MDKYLLVSIDIFTRKVLVIPIKLKNAEAITEGMKTIIDAFKPKIITTDNGSEYISKVFTIY